MNKLKIVSDGTALGTHVYAGNTEINGISCIKILPINPGGLVSAVLTFPVVALDLVADLKGDK